jgi:uncharacterized membrane protein YkoI
MRLALHTLTILVAFGGVAVARPGQPPPVKKTLAEAEVLALQVVPGTIVESELEREKGRWVYSIEIRPDGGGEIEVLIDADDGSTVAVEHDDDDGDD